MKLYYLFRRCYNQVLVKVTKHPLYYVTVFCTKPVISCRFCIQNWLICCVHYFELVRRLFIEICKIRNM